MSEEDTVTVGQDLIKLELGGAPEGKKDEGAEKPKESSPTPAEAEKPKETQASKPAPPPSEKPKEAPAKKESPKPQGAAEAKPALGSREERRVCFCHVFAMFHHTAHTDIANMVPSICSGQDEPYASEDR